MILEHLNLIIGEQFCSVLVAKKYIFTLVLGLLTLCENTSINFHLKTAEPDVEMTGVYWKSLLILVQVCSSEQK